MENVSDQLGRDITDLYGLATRVEGKGQYNMGKLLRAAVDSLTRRHAFEKGYNREISSILQDFEDLRQRLASYQLDPEYARLMALSCEVMSKDQQSYLADFPDPYVCRRCGVSAFGQPPQVCPICGAWGTTFQRFEAVYWLSEFDPIEVIHHLEKTPSLYEDLIRNIDNDMLEMNPPDSGWSMHQVLNHVKDAEGVLNMRVNLLLDEDNPTLEFKAVFEWTDLGEAPQDTAHDILEMYKASRTATLSRLEGLSMENWWRTGQHQEFGQVTLLEQASYFAAHELTHLRQINAILTNRNTPNQA